MNEKVVSSKNIFRGDIFQVNSLFITLPDGRRVVREVMERPPTVIVVAVDKKKDTFLIQEYRSAINKIVWHLPAGRLKPGEQPRQAANRELQEEIGYRAKKYQLLYSFQGGGSWKWHRYLYLARDLSANKIPGDPDEDIKVQKIPLKKAAKMAVDGILSNADSALALIRAYQIVHRRKII
ncbi:MAG: NUDIX hydrolase [Patescibacteria group bacterium]